MKSNHQGVIALIIIVVVCIILHLFVPKNMTIDDMEKRCVWVSYSDLQQLDYHSLESFKESFQKVINTSINNKCNVLIVHVRAFQDAMYKTNRFPLSTVIIGRKVSFDPLEIMIQLCHQSNIKFEAWINPYRISLNQYTYQQFISYSPIKKWISDNKKVIHYGEYQYILNSGSQDVIDYIVNGVEEIVRNYKVDGIHFDDYFYVENTHQNISREKRLSNVNRLIKRVYKTIKDIDRDVLFGISPAGNIENCILAGADIYSWLSEDGYVDYLMPQIYWTNQYKNNTPLFTNRLKQWNKLKKNDVDLYIGLALYQAGKELEYDQGWSKSHKNIIEQVEILFQYDIKGYALFHYQNLLEKSGQKEMKHLLDEI